MKYLIVQTGVRRVRRRWWPEKGYGAQLAAFLDAARSGKPPEVTVLDGARATIVCLRMLEPGRTLRPCSIDIEDVLR